MLMGLFIPSSREHTPPFQPRVPLSMVNRREGLWLTVWGLHSRRKERRVAPNQAPRVVPTTCTPSSIKVGRVPAGAWGGERSGLGEEFD